MFKKAGLDVRITRLNSGAAVMAGVIGGSIEIGKSSILNLLSAHVKGVPLTMIAPGGLYLSKHQTASSVASVRATIRNGSDLNGKIISTAALRDINVLATDAWIDQHGGDSSTVKWVEIPPLDATGALEQGRIDVATLANPMLTEAVIAGKTRIAAPVMDGIAVRYMLTGWFTTSTYADANRDAIRRFSEVMRDAEAYCNAHPEGTIELISGFTGIDAAILGHMLHPVYPVALERRDIQPVIDAGVKYKFLERAFDAAEIISPYAVKAR
jgi:NitT/TauT family transport system substrate-binding protein